MADDLPCPLASNHELQIAFPHRLLCCLSRPATTPPIGISIPDDPTNETPPNFTSRVQSCGARLASMFPALRPANHHQILPEDASLRTLQYIQKSWQDLSQFDQDRACNNHCFLVWEPSAHDGGISENHGDTSRNVIQISIDAARICYVSSDHQCESPFPLFDSSKRHQNLPEDNLLHLHQRSPSDLGRRNQKRSCNIERRCTTLLCSNGSISKSGYYAWESYEDIEDQEVYSLSNNITKE